jgi:hypothetical protein
MQNTTRPNRLIATALLLGSLVTLGSASSFAADGSDRLKLKAAPAASKLQRLAEDGSERSRHYWLERKLDIAEGGADRLLASRKA